MNLSASDFTDSALGWCDCGKGAGLVLHAGQLFLNLWRAEAVIKAFPFLLLRVKQ